MARTVKINPDAPQKNARFLTLEVSGRDYFVSVVLFMQGSHQACQAIKELEIFDRTREIKVDPDKPLEGVRLAALQVTESSPLQRCRTTVLELTTSSDICIRTLKMLTSQCPSEEKKWVYFLVFLQMKKTAS